MPILCLTLRSPHLSKVRLNAAFIASYESSYDEKGGTLITLGNIGASDRSRVLVTEDPAYIDNLLGGILGRREDP